MKASDFVALVRTFVGVKFRHQGRSRHGVDCAGLFVAAMREGACLPAAFRDPEGYGRLPSTELIAMVAKFCTPVASPEPACLVLLRWPLHADPSHLALCTGPTLIHAYAFARRVVEHGYRGAWLRDTHSLYRLPGLTYE